MKTKNNKVSFTREEKSIKADNHWLINLFMDEVNIQPCNSSMNKCRDTITYVFSACDIYELDTMVLEWECFTCGEIDWYGPQTLSRTLRFCLAGNFRNNYPTLSIKTKNKFAFLEVTNLYGKCRSANAKITI